MRIQRIITTSVVACYGLLQPALAADATPAQHGRKSGDRRVGMATAKEQRRRQLGSKGSKGKGHNSKASRSSKGSESKGKGKGTGKGKGKRKSATDGPRTIYETVEFAIRSTGDDFCGSRDDLANDLETAFLDFFEREQEECNPKREQDVDWLVLVEYTEPPACSSPSRRRLQNDQVSEGVFNRKVSCRRACGRGRRLLDVSPVDRRLSKGSKGSSSKGGSSKGGSTKGGSTKGSSTKGSPRKSSSSCPVDLVDSLRDAGFDGVRDARITRIKEVNCSHGSKACENSGSCCGVCGCGCSFPSESLCEDNDYCIGGARPFEEDFCEDFFDENEEGSFSCEKDYCD